MHAARALAKLLKPIKLNYQISGNTIPVCTCTSFRVSPRIRMSAGRSTRARPHSLEHPRTSPE
jgi:hypothetical protein